MVRGGAAAEKKREEKTKASLPRRSTRSRKRKADKSLELSHFMDEKVRTCTCVGVYIQM